MTGDRRREIYVSSNGDRWHLLCDPVTEHSFVRHCANPASDGHVTDDSLPAFLSNGHGGPEHQALWQLIATLADGDATSAIAAS